MVEAWQFRPSTLDQAIFNGVVLLNEYNLPNRFAPNDVLIDIGSHIGSFAEAAVTRGCENIFCIEADPANVAIAEVNLEPHIQKGFVKLVRGAAWRSDPNDDELYFDGYHPFPASYADMQGILNTGNGSVIWPGGGNGTLVIKFAFDEIVDVVTNHGGKRVRLLKLDCEGAEWPILLTSRRLDLIDEICGEFHEIGGEFLEISEDRLTRQPIFSYEGSSKFTIDLLVGYLSSVGFTVTYRRHCRPTGDLEGLGLFFAKRGTRVPETLGDH